MLILVLIACTNQKIYQQVEAEKLNLSREWAKSAASAENLEKTLSYWAEDATIISRGQPTIKGSEAIRKMIEGSYKIPGFEITWEPKEAFVSESGDLGYIIANNSYIKMKDSLGNVITINRSGIEIWKKQKDGSWKNAIDMAYDEPTMQP